MIRPLPLCSGLLALALPTLAAAHADETSVNATALAAPSEIVDCTLTDGSAAHCAKYVVTYVPEGLEIGPFCPATLNEAGGIWRWSGENPGLYRLDHDFWEMADGLGYRFFDDEGNVYISDISVAAPEQDHTCINVSEDPTVEMTVLIPVEPIMADEPSALGTVSKVGLGIDGVPIFSDAPTVAMTGHLPALDTCGGHVDPGGWFHWHSTATDIETVYAEAGVEADCALPQDPSALFGYAFDGFAIYGSAEADGSAPVGLDACLGHVGTTVGDLEGVYHYHAGDEFPNLHACLVGLQAEGNFSTTAQAGVGANPPEGTEITRGNPPRGGGPGGMPPGFEKAAAALNVTAEELFAAMEAAGGRNADLEVVADSLGIDIDDLRRELPERPR